MTGKLYYEDCHLSRFHARVTGCRKTENGYAVTLDQTAFYPEGGGQACDLGTLGNAQVLDVQEQGEDVIHLCSDPLIPGQEVEGILNYERRFDLMQQHTGEHIFSGIIHRRYGWQNVGFHMGADVMTVDFDGVVPAEDLPGIESEINEAIWKNLPVRCWYPSPEELPHVPYRTKKALTWPVRIVEIPGYDRCACCGVHTAFTGEVGLLKIFSVTGFRGGSRLELACGRRALQYLGSAFEQNRQVSQAFSAKIMETGAAARLANEMLNQNKYTIAGLQKQLFDGIARSCTGRGDVVRFEAGLDSALVRELADRIAGVCGGVAAVFSGTDETGYAFCLVSRAADLRPLGKAMTAALSGRGGGKACFQQGRVMAAKNAIEAFFRQKF